MLVNCWLMRMEGAVFMQRLHKQGQLTRQKVSEEVTFHIAQSFKN